MSPTPPPDDDYRALWERLSDRWARGEPIDMPNPFDNRRVERPIIDEDRLLAELTRIVREAYGGVITRGEADRMLGEHGVVAINTERDEQVMGIRIELTLSSGRRVMIRMSDEERHLLSGPRLEIRGQHPQIVIYDEVDPPRADTERLGRMAMDRAPHLHPEMRRRPRELTDISVAYRDAMSYGVLDPGRRMSREHQPSEAYDEMIARAEAIRREASSELDAYEGYEAMVERYGPVFVAGPYSGELFYEPVVTPDHPDRDWEFSRVHDSVWYRKHHVSDPKGYRCNACVPEEDAFTCATLTRMTTHLQAEHGFDSSLRTESINPYQWAHAQAVA